MTNINCSEKCVYQKDGKCFLENVKLQKINTTHSCAYFTDAVSPQSIVQQNKHL